MIFPTPFHNAFNGLPNGFILYYQRLISNAFQHFQRFTMLLYNNYLQHFPNKELNGSNLGNQRRRGVGERVEKADITTKSSISSVAKSSNGYHERLNGWGKNLNGWSCTAERQKRIFEQLAVNGWTAYEKFRTARGERMNGRRKISNGSRWTAERHKKNFERLKVNGWTAEEKFRTACGETKAV